MIYIVVHKKLQVMVLPIIAGKIPVKQHGGFTYLLVLLLVIAVSLALTVISETIAITNQREREAELLFVGKQYINAIKSYYKKSPAGAKQMPQTLKSLISDNRGIEPIHHLRKLYPDPMTGSNEWGLILNSSGKIIGIYSLSQDKPLAIGGNLGFSLDSNTNGTAQTYQDWKFVFNPMSSSDVAAQKDKKPLLDQSGNPD